MKENPLNELIEKYNSLKQKYNLPEFSEINNLFDIEDIDPNTEFLLRKIRKLVLDKVSNYARFTEVILNPSNATMFFFKVLKNLDQDDKTKISKIYETLGKSELKVLSLDIEYNEEKEAEFIKTNYKLFKEEIKEDLIKLIEKLSNGEENSIKMNGSYLG